MSSIRLHPKFGLNPTVTLCFWCGGSKNEVALLGASYKGEAPGSMLLDYEPCDKCKTYMSQGVTLIEASREPRHKGQREIQSGVYPTGRMWVIRREAAERIFEGLASDKVLIEVGVAEKIGLTEEGAA